MLSLDAPLFGERALHQPHRLHELLGQYLADSRRLALGGQHVRLALVVAVIVQINPVSRAALAIPAEDQPPLLVDAD